MKRGAARAGRTRRCAGRCSRDRQWNSNGVWACGDDVDERDADGRVASGVDGSGARGQGPVSPRQRCPNTGVATDGRLVDTQRSARGHHGRRTHRGGAGDGDITTGGSAGALWIDVLPTTPGRFARGGPTLDVVAGPILVEHQRAWRRGQRRHDGWPGQGHEQRGRPGSERNSKRLAGDLQRHAAAYTHAHPGDKGRSDGVHPRPPLSGSAAAARRPEGFDPATLACTARRPRRRLCRRR